MNGWAGYLVTGEKVNIFTLFWCHPLHIHAPSWLAHLTVPAPILTLQPRMGRLCSQCLPLFRPRTSPQLSFLAPADIKLQCLFWQQPACVLGLFDWKAKYSDCRKKHDLGPGCGEEEKPDRRRGGKLGIVHSNHHIAPAPAIQGHRVEGSKNLWSSKSYIFHSF